MAMRWVQRAIRLICSKTSFPCVFSPRLRVRLNVLIHSSYEVYLSSCALSIVFSEIFFSNPIFSLLLLLLFLFSKYGPILILLVNCSSLFRLLCCLSSIGRSNFLLHLVSLDYLNLGR